MISFVDGVVAEIKDNSVVIQAGPFGLDIAAPKATLMNCKQGLATRLHTHFIVREDQMALYGFHNEDLRTLFSYLIGVSGVGPKLALTLLSSLDSSLIANAIINEDAGLLSSAPGVGKKMAERIIVDLKNKLPEQLIAGPKGAASGKTQLLSDSANDAIEALLALGYRESQVKATVSELALASPDESAESYIRKSLAKLR